MEDDQYEPIRLTDQALRTWRGGAAARELIEEYESFLEGRYAEQPSRGGGHVPVWAWTNLTAHGSELALHRALVSSRGGLGEACGRSPRCMVARTADAVMARDVRLCSVGPTGPDTGQVSTNGRSGR